MLMINDSQPPGFDVSSYTIEEINSITSEYTLKNTVKMFNLQNKRRSQFTLEDFFHDIYPFYL